MHGKLTALVVKGLKSFNESQTKCYKKDIQEFRNNWKARIYAFNFVGTRNSERSPKGQILKYKITLGIHFESYAYVPDSKVTSFSKYRSVSIQWFAWGGEIQGKQRTNSHPLIVFYHKLKYLHQFPFLSSLLRYHDSYDCQRNCIVFVLFIYHLI